MNSHRREKRALSYRTEDLMLKRLIEVALPLKEVSEQSAREKSIRHGHISTLHIWWARRAVDPILWTANRLV